MPRRNHPAKHRPSKRARRRQAAHRARKEEARRRKDRRRTRTRKSRQHTHIKPTDQIEDSGIYIEGVPYQALHPHNYDDDDQPQQQR